MNEPSPRASQRIRAARAYRRPSGLSATILALSIIFVLAYVFLIRTPPQVPTPQLQALRGTYSWRPAAGGVPEAASAADPAGATEGAGTFVAVAGGDAGGSFRGAAPASGATVAVACAYDAHARTESTVVSGVASEAARSTSTVGAWPPAWRLATRDPLDYQGLAAVVRSAVEDGDRSVGIKPLEQTGRKVWRAAMTLDGAPVELVVDQLSGVVTWYADPAGTFTAEVAWDSPPPAGRSLSVTPPAGAAVDRRTDDTYAYAPSLAAAGASAGFAPLSSGLAPDGYALGAAATAPVGSAPQSWLSAGTPVSSPPARPQDGESMVAALYLRGLSWFTVEQLGPRSARRTAAGLQDVLATLGAQKLSFERTPLNYGEFAGQSAATWYERSGPTLFVGDARYVVRVSGGLTRQELLSFAEGLKPPAAEADGTSRSPAPTASTSPSAAP